MKSFKAHDSRDYPAKVGSRQITGVFVLGGYLAAIHFYIDKILSCSILQAVLPIKKGFIKMEPKEITPERVIWIYEQLERLRARLASNRTSIEVYSMIQVMLAKDFGLSADLDSMRHDLIVTGKLIRMLEEVLPILPALCEACGGRREIRTKKGDFIGPCRLCSDGWKSSAGDRQAGLKVEIQYFLASHAIYSVDLEKMSLSDVLDFFDSEIRTAEDDIGLRTGAIYRARESMPDSKVEKEHQLDKVYLELRDLKTCLHRRRWMERLRFLIRAELADPKPCSQCDHLGNTSCQICFGKGSAAAWRLAGLKESQPQLEFADESLLTNLNPKEIESEVEPTV